MTNQLIRRFSLNGDITSNNIEQTRGTIHKTIVEMMRNEGFVPVLDLDPVWQWSWIKNDEFRFTYTWQGVYVGEDKAWQTEGVSNGKQVPSIPKRK